MTNVLCLSNAAQLILFAARGDDNPLSDPKTLGFAAVVVVAGLAGAAYFFAKRFREKWLKTSSGALFNGLCGAHELSPSERALLKKIAQAYQLPQPARLFLEPGYFDPDRLAPILGKATEPVISLRNKLFT